MGAKPASYEGLMHAGAGTGLILVQVSAIIPGLLPTLALAGLITLVVVLPGLVLGAVASILLAPPYVVWRLARRAAGARDKSVTRNSMSVPST